MYTYSTAPGKLTIGIWDLGFGTGIQDFLGIGTGSGTVHKQ